MALSVDLALNARQFQAGTKDAEKALEDLTDVVEDFTRDASKAGEDSADAMDELGDAAKDAEREFDDVTDAAKKTKREIEQAEGAADDFGRAGKKAGDDTRDGMRRAEDSVQEFRDEANSTARESAASFDGSAESIVDSFQEIAANAFGGFGPAGAAAGLLAAAGIGLAMSGFEDVQEAQERVNEMASEWASAYAESGQSVMTTAQQVAAVQDVYLNQYADLTDNAREWGVSVETAALAMTGDQNALAESRAALNARMEETNAIADANTSAYGDVSLAQQGANQEVINGDSALQEYEQAAAQALEIDAARNAYLVQLATTTAGATAATNEFGDAVYTLPDGHQIIIDAETGQASEDVDNVQFQVNNMQDGNVTVHAATGPVNASSVNNYVASRPSVTLAVHAVTSRGERIPI